MVQKQEILLPSFSHLLESTETLKASFYALIGLLRYLNICTLSNVE